MFRNVSIIGLGLLGGSICRALKEKNKDIKISVYGRDINKLTPIINDGFADYADTIDNFNYNTELVVVCVPVITSVDIIKKIISDSRFPDSSLAIDVGSVKGFICDEIEKIQGSEKFIGCHPMAGLEKTGYEYSRSDLYKGSTVIITPGLKNSESNIGKIKEFWEYIGAEIITTTSDKHDLSVAVTSHLPHILAASLVRIFNKMETGEGFVGNGFRDVTRISAGSPDMWSEIVSGNKEKILKVIDMAVDEIFDFKEMIMSETDNQKIFEYFSKAKSIRDRIKKS